MVHGLHRNCYLLNRLRMNLKQDRLRLHARTSMAFVVLLGLVVQAAAISAAASSCIEAFTGRVRLTLSSQFSTFDYSRSYTRTKAEQEIDRRLPAFAWNVRHSEYASQLTLESVQQMLDFAGETYFGKSKYYSAEPADEQVRKLSRERVFPNSDRQLNPRQYAELVYSVAYRILAGEQSNVNVLAKLFASMFFAETETRTVDQGVGVIDKSNADAKLHAVIPEAHAHMPIVVSRLDHLDITLMAAAGHFPIGLLKSRTGRWDNTEGEATEFPAHDRSHRDIQISEIAQQAGMISAARRMAMLREEYAITRELAIEALTQPTPLERAVAVSTLFFFKHEIRPNLLIQINSQEYLDRIHGFGSSTDPFDLTIVHEHWDFIGELNGIGLVLAKDVLPVLPSIRTALLRARDRVDAQYIETLFRRRR